MIQGPHYESMEAAWDLDPSPAGDWRPFPGYQGVKEGRRMVFLIDVDMLKMDF